MPEKSPLATVDRDDDDDVITIGDNDVNSSKTKRTRLSFPFGACRVCSDSATGIHYGIATCEGCKGFFKRSILRKEKYRCYFDNTCLVNVTNRNRCKACRFRRCLDEGMSVDGVKMGRIPKLVKERALKELKEQQLKQHSTGEISTSATTTTTTTTNTDAHGRDSTCSSMSDRSIENDDPNPMETAQFMFAETSAIQRQGNLTSKKVSPLEDQSRCSFVNTDVSIDEPVAHSPYSTHCLRHAQTIDKKLQEQRANGSIDLTEDESKFVIFVRSSNLDLYLRHSKHLKQMVSRMNQMIENRTSHYPGENTTLEQFLHAVRTSCPVYIRSIVLYVRQIPGMENLKMDNLHQIIFRGIFNFFLLKYHQLCHDNGQCYLLIGDDFQVTRHWMDEYLGKELSEVIFDFSRSFRQLKLTDTEMALIIAMQMFSEAVKIDETNISRLFHSSYIHALYTELCHQRGESQGKILCNRILQLLERLSFINELYQRDVGSRVLQV